MSNELPDPGRGIYLTLRSLGLEIEAMAPPPRMSGAQIPYFAFDVWPPPLPGMRPTYTEYFSQMARLSETLREAFSIGLGLEQGYFRGMIDRHLSVLAVHHYPAQPTPPQPDPMRAGAYTEQKLARLRDSAQVAS